jgi:Leucine-rich repeat (LRR) protein
MRDNTITTYLPRYGRAVKIFNYLLLLGSCGLLLAMPPPTLAATDCAAQTQLPQSECEALLALYNSTNGPSWTNNTGWNTNDMPCSCTGVTCSDRHVTIIKLDSNNLTGSLPPELGNLSHLQTLHLHNNQLSGSLPSEWSRLTDLQTLFLSFNQLSGNLPTEWEQLSNLQWLYLHNNQLNGSLPPQWGQLASLQTLELSNNQLSGSLPPQWSQLPQLQQFYLHNNQLSGAIPSNLTQLEKISQFYVNYNRLTADDPAVVTFLNQYNPNWQTTQTLPPTGISATVLSSQSIRVSWTPILYQADGGYYEVGMATNAGGPYAFQPVAGNKTAKVHTVTGLLPNTLYYLVVRTYTPAHDWQQNNLTSDWSVEVSAETAATPPMHTLTITTTSGGIISSAPPGIQCEGDCEESYAEGTTVTLTATPNTGYAFSSWGGACSGTTTSVDITLNTNQTCSATFAPIRHTLTVTTTSGGIISSAPPGIQCEEDCEESYAEGTTVTLTATPNTGYAFSSWGGACSGTTTSVDITLNTDKTCSATFIPTVTSCTAQTQLPQSECEALLALYNSTNGSSWKSNTGWNTNNTPCSWKGVTCRSGHVTAIVLTDNNLTGNLPPELGNLANLQRFYLGNNQLSGSLPSEWSTLVNLQWLYLDNNQLSGNLPPEWSNLANLQTLFLNSNQVSGNLSPEWSQLANLQTLYLYNNQLSGSLPPEWGQLANLQTLYLKDNQLSGSIPPEWSKMASLQRLYLSNNQLNGTISSDFTQLGKIWWFYVDYNRLTAADPTVAAFISEHGNSKWQATQTLPPTEISAIALPSQSVLVRWTPILYQNHGGYYEVGVATTTSGPYTFQPVAGNKKATTHTVTGLLSNMTYSLVVRTYTPAHDTQQNSLTSDLSVEISTENIPQICAVQTQLPQSECEALQALYNSTNGPGWKNKTGWYTNDKPCSWKGVTCSEGYVIAISLISNNLIGSLPRELSNLTNLQTLYLHKNQLSGSLPLEWGNLANLQTLYLHSNQLSGSLPPEWSQLASLQTLGLYSNQLSGNLPPEWSTLVNLQWLYLDNNQLSGNLPPEWGNLTQLQMLYLHDNQLSSNLPPQWGQLANLQRLYLNNNQLSGSLPLEWNQLASLEWLYLNNNQLNGAIPSNFTQLGKISKFYVNYNMFTTADPTVAAFISEHGDSNWQATQTLPPTGISAMALSSQSIQVNWTPILYQNHGGYYEVGNPTTAGGSYTFQQVAGDKTANTHTVTGLSPNTTYYLAVRTHTPAHDTQQNNLTSDWSVEVSTGTPPLPMHTLTVTTTSGGTISSTPAGIQCDGDCEESYAEGTTVTLTATPNTGYAFSGWGGACSGTATSVDITLNVDQTCSATFVALTYYTLMVSISGGGIVNSVPDGIQCASDCSENYLADTQVTLNATPMEGFTFSHWIGHCDGTTATATVTLSESKQCVAHFTAPYALSITRLGPGSVSSLPAGIDCGEDCHEVYASSTTVTLTATAAPTALFNRWGGDCSSPSATVTIQVGAAKNCTAEFISLSCEPAIYSLETQQLTFPRFAVAMYSPLTDMPNDEHALCSREDHAPLSLKYDPEQQGLLFATEPEISCAAQFIKPADTCFPVYSAQGGTLELPLVKVSADTVFPGDKQLKTAACYQVRLVQGVNLPSSVMLFHDFTDSRWFTLVSAEEIDCP